MILYRESGWTTTLEVVTKDMPVAWDGQPPEVPNGVKFLYETDWQPPANDMPDNATYMVRCADLGTLPANNMAYAASGNGDNV